MMPKDRTIAGIALAVSLLGAHRAGAADVCFTLPGLSGGIGYALESFVKPGKSRCKPVSGFSTAPPGPAFVLSGTACTKADGTELRLGLVGTPFIAGPGTFQGGCTLPLPSLTGGTCVGIYTLPGGTISDLGFTSSISLTACAAAVP